MAAGYSSILAIASGDGPTLTAAAAATCLPASMKYNFPANPLAIPMFIELYLFGRVSCVLTTPGTFRLDFRIGGTVIADTTALNMNVVAHTNVLWRAKFELYVRAIAGAANVFPVIDVQSSALILGSTGAVSGNNCTLTGPAGPDAAPTVGGNLDSTATGAFDVFFTQTVATGSFTVHGGILRASGLAQI